MCVRPYSTDVCTSLLHCCMYVLTPLMCVRPYYPHTLCFLTDEGEPVLEDAHPEGGRGGKGAAATSVSRARGEPWQRAGSGRNEDGTYVCTCTCT